MKSKSALHFLALVTGFCLFVSDVFASDTLPLPTEDRTCSFPYLAFSNGESLFRVNVWNHSSTFRPVETFYLKDASLDYLFTEISQSYAYRMNVEMLIKSYQEMLRVSFSSAVKDCLTNSQTTIGTVDSNLFGDLFHSLPGFGTNFSNFRLKSSLSGGAPKFRLSYRFSFGTISSLWLMDKNDLTFKVNIPFKGDGRHDGTALNLKDILEKSNQILYNCPVDLIP